MNRPGWTYLAWGMRIRTAIPVRELRECTDLGKADIELRIGKPRSKSVIACFSLPNGARATIESERLVSVECDRGTESLHPSLIRSIMAVILRWKGRIVLHASAIEFAGRTFVLAGSSGAGKTTLAATLCARGGKLLSDELCAVMLDDDGALVLPGSRLLAIHPDARGLSGLAPAKVKEPVRNGRILTEVPLAAQAGRPDAIVLLRWGAGEKVNLLPASGVEGAKALLQARFQPGVGPARWTAQELERLGRLSSICPTYLLVRDKSTSPITSALALASGLKQIVSE